MRFPTRRTATVLGAAAVVVVAGASAGWGAAPTVTMDPRGDIGVSGLTVDVSGTASCNPGAVETVFAQVSEQTPLGFTKAQGSTRVVCDGAVHSWAATLLTIGVPLQPGKALGQVTAAGSGGSANNAPGVTVTLA